MTREELISRAIEMLNDDNDIFENAVNELDSYNGFADGWRCEPMDYLDDYFYGTRPSELLEQLSDDFNIRDNYFYCGTYGVESTDYPADIYRDNTSSEEVFDELLDNWNRVDIYGNDEFNEIMDSIFNEDYDDEEDEDEQEEGLPYSPYNPNRNATNYTGWIDEE